MQKFTLLLSLLLLNAMAFGQRANLKLESNREQLNFQPKNYNQLKLRKAQDNVARQTVAACANDTIQYTDQKARTLTVLTLVGRGQGRVGEGLGQWFEGPQPIMIHGVEFYGRAKNAGTTVNAQVSIYSARADSTPGTMLGSATVLLNNTALSLAALRQNVNFTTPIVVNGPYLVVVEAAPTSSDTMQLIITGNGDGFGENLSKLRASDSQGTFWISVRNAYGIDVDFYTFPIVSYNISSRFIPSSNLVTGATVTFTNQSSPIFFSRFYNLFRLFNQTGESFFWNLGQTADFGNAVDTFSVYNTPGDYSVTLEAVIAGYRNFTSNDYCNTDSVAVIKIKDASLPVTLKTYDVVSEKNRVKIVWTTAAEINNDYYEVERSTNGVDFEPLIKVQAGFNAAGGKSYTGYDENPTAGLNYYRLVQYDKDGRKTYYHVKRVDFKVAAGFELQIYPNPATNNLFVRVNSGNIKRITLTDASGRLVKSYNPASGTNNMLQSIPVKNLKDGIYMVHVMADGKTATQKVVINRK